MMRCVPWLGALLTAAAVAAAQPPDVGPLTPTQLGDLLRKLGFEPKALAKTNDWYQIHIDRDGMKFIYSLKLFDKNKQVLLYTSLVEVPENAPAAVLRRLLEENDVLGRPTFIFNKTDKNIYFLTPLENRGITSARMRKEIDQFDGQARKLRPLWRADNFVRLWDVPEDVAKEGLAALRGEWKMVDYWRGGKMTPRADVKKSDIRLGIEGDGKARWQSLVNGQVKKDSITVAVDPRRSPKAFDLIWPDGAVQTAVYNLEDDTLTLTAADGTGLPRPAGLDADKTRIKMVLKRTGGQP